MAEQRVGDSGATGEPREGSEFQEVTGRPFRVGDEATVIGLFRAGFERWPAWEVSEGSEGFLRWALEGPGSTRGQIDIAERGSRIVGAALRMNRPVRVEGALRPAQLSMYVAVDESMRAQGVSKVLVVASPVTYEVGWGFSQVHAYVHVHERLGSIVENPLTVFLRVQNARRAAADRGDGRRLVNALAYGWMQLQGRLRRRRSGTAGCSVRQVEVFDERVEGLWEQASEHFDFIALRTAEFLNWRYCDPRAGEFTALVAEEDGELLGYAVLCVRGARGAIVDLLVLPGREDAAHALVDEAMRQCEVAGTSVVECVMVRQHLYAEVLRRAGFVRLPSRSRAMAPRFNVWGPALTPIRFDFMADEQAAIHLMIGDSDLV